MTPTFTPPGTSKPTFAVTKSVRRLTPTLTALHTQPSLLSLVSMENDANHCTITHSQWDWRQPWHHWTRNPLLLSLVSMETDANLDTTIYTIMQPSVAIVSQYGDWRQPWHHYIYNHATFCCYHESVWKLTPTFTPLHNHATFCCCRLSVWRLTLTLTPLHNHANFCCYHESVWRLTPTLTTLYTQSCNFLLLSLVSMEIDANLYATIITIMQASVATASRYGDWWQPNWHHYTHSRLLL